MTSRRAKVVRTELKMRSHRGRLVLDSKLATLEGINCTSKEFIEWFLVVDSEKACNFSGTDTELIDLGQSKVELSVGTILEVDFDDYFSAWLEMRIRQEKSVLDNLLMEYCRQLELPEPKKLEKNSTKKK